MNKIIMFLLVILPILGFAVQYKIITPDHKKHQHVRKCISQLGEKQNQDYTALRVYIDGIPDSARFVSGMESKNKKGGDICPTYFFPNPNSFVVDVEEFLFSQEFPIDRFDFLLILNDGLEIARTANESLGSQLTVLRNKYQHMQNARAVVRKHKTPATLTDKSETKAKFYRELDRHLKTRTDVLEWKQSYEFLGKTAESFAEALKERHTRITKHFEELEPAINFFEEIKKFEVKEMYSEKDIPKLKLKHLCAARGAHAEDALILKILYQLSHFTDIPSKIEIYGSKDPCSQCQVKLQWLANKLPQKLAKELNLPPKSIKICYYSDEGFYGTCLCTKVREFNYNERKPNAREFKEVEKNAQDMLNKKWGTRALEDEGKLIKFTFATAADATDKELRPLLFPPPPPLPSHQKMLRGEYVGRIMKSSGNYAYDVKVEQIVSLDDAEAKATEVIGDEGKSALEKIYRGKECVTISFKAWLAQMPTNFWREQVGESGVGLNNHIKFTVIESKEPTSRSKATYFVEVKDVKKISP